MAGKERRSRTHAAHDQVLLLEDEGVCFDVRSHVVAGFGILVRRPYSWLMPTALKETLPLLCRLACCCERRIMLTGVL